ncbi:hypothetical protein COCNU_scaffold038434G000010 [Cocos nucifera]|nr:hypothetical protein [Cocos nucifera]
MGSSGSKQGQKKEGKDACFSDFNLTKEGAADAAKTAAVGAFGLLVLWGFSRFVMGGDGNDGKLMKAPGKKGQYISRDFFESDPKAYFRRLHDDGY